MVVERKRRQISAYTLDKFTEADRKGVIIHDVDIRLYDELYKHNDKKTYQVSKHHRNGLEDLSSCIKLYPEKLPNL